MGDGVNIAARLENICDPGAICLSEQAYWQVKSRLDLAVNDLGTKELKNIPEPVHVFSLEVGKPVQAKLATLPISAVAAPPLSIVVLPFKNLSGDAKQDYLADVLTDELTTYISRIPGSFVIARNTAFTYKGKPTDIKEIGKELGVRYALDGSVQPTEKRIRTNTQLIDTETGAHLWAEKFDTDKTDLLQTEDEIVTRLARTLQLQLADIEAAKLERAKSDSPAADELAQRCSAAINSSGTYVGTEADAAFPLCEQALEKDPENVTALALLGSRYAWLVQIYQSHDRARDIAQAEDLTSRTLALDPNNARAFFNRSNLYVVAGRLTEASAAAERALALSPTLMEAYIVLDLTWLYSGQPEKTIDAADRAIRLSPRDPQLSNFLGHKGAAYFMLEDYSRAVDFLGQGIALNPSPTPTYFYLIAALALSGREEEARQTLTTYLSQPAATIKTIAMWKLQNNQKNPRYLAMRERCYDGLRKAGMPEQ
jgi:adenylate cyclase